MRFSISDYSVSPQRKGWGAGWPADRSADMRRVRADTSGTRVNVHRKVAPLVDILLDQTELRRYLLEPKQCGGYHNRPIKGTKKSSNHAWGLAVDLNWSRNPQRFDGVLRTDFPKWLPPLWGKYGFAWGGNYRGRNKDPMHFEFMGAPADADDMLARARRDFGARPAVAAAVRKYTVQRGDTLGQIAGRLHVPGGWKVLYQLNRGVIGNDPDRIVAGMVLRLP